MTISMRMQQRIRTMDAEGVDHAAIARRLGVSRTTVVKYANMKDLSPTPRESRGSRSAVEPYAETVDGWLTADLRMPRKQRHTARRVYARMVKELEFNGSYSSVQRWVRNWRQAHREESEGFAELEWAPRAARRSISVRPAR